MILFSIFFLLLFIKFGHFLFYIRLLRYFKINDKKHFFELFFLILRRSTLIVIKITQLKVCMTKTIFNFFLFSCNLRYNGKS